MRIEYENTYSDMLKFSLIHQFYSPVLQGLYLLLCGMAFLPGSDESLDQVPPWLLALAWYVAIWVLQSAFNAIYLISRQNHAILTRHVLEVRGDALVEETKFNKSFFYWPGIVRAISRPGFAAVYVAQHHACVIPNRFFSSQAERRSFLALVQGKIQTTIDAGDTQP
jgi:hypothetical protein